MQIEAIGIDLGKTVFHLVALDAQSQIVEKKKFSRKQLLEHMVNRQAKVIGLEACPGAHWLGHALQKQGHTIKIIPPQFVRPFVKGNKNDYLDAEAIAEAVQRKNMRFAPLKSSDQLDVQAIHRARQAWIRRRTALANQIRAFLLERGVTIRTGLAYLRDRMPDLIANAAGQLSAIMVALLQEHWQEWQHLEEHIEKADAQLRALAGEHEACQRLQTIPGIGLLTASALVAAVGCGQDFRRGRDLSAWIGLVPRQHSTGGHNKLLGISKRGNAYIRQLLVHGARSVYASLKRPEHAMGRWLDSLTLRKKPSVAIVALANKLARIAWAVLTTNQPYRPALMTEPGP